MIQWRTSYPEISSFSWGDSRLRRTLPAAKLSPWYPHSRSTDYLDWIHSESSASSFGCTDLLVLARQQSFRQLFLCSPPGFDQNFGGNFFFSRGKKGHDEGRFLFSTIAYQLVLNVPGLRQHINRIYYGNKSITSYKVNGRTTTSPYNRYVPILVTITMLLSCYHRRIGWLPWQGDPTVDSPTPVRNDHNP